MDHEQAIKNQAVERYLLGELSTVETEEFERHYFACSECAGDLEAGALLEENARIVLAGEKTRLAPQPKATSPPASASWWDRFTAIWTRPLAVVPMAAAVALLAVVSYQNVALRRELETPRPVSAHALMARSRGDQQVVTVSRPDPYFTVYMDPPGDAPSGSYRCELRDQTGAAPFSMEAPVPPPGQPVTLLIPTRTLSPGSYTLILRNPGGGELATYIFTLQFK